MGLFFKKEAPDHRYVQVKMTVNGEVTLGWMVDSLAEDEEQNRSSFNKKYGISYIRSIPDEVDGYPVLGLTPSAMRSLYSQRTTLPQNAVFVCLRTAQQRFLSAKFDSDKEYAIPRLQSNLPWKISFYSSDGVGYTHYTVRGGYISQKDENGEKRELWNLRLQHYGMDAHTKDVLMHFAADIHTYEGKKMGYGEFWPCLVREDIADSFTLLFPRNGETFF
ncbi:MAG: hypothetical protein IJW46_05810 [Clostridia bacterium]|nr:hypothetical protein [Clostridia bacterium]